MCVEAGDWRAWVFANYLHVSFGQLLQTQPGTPELDAQVVRASLFLLVNKHDKLLLYHCREPDIDVEETEKLDASIKVRSCAVTIQ